MTKRALITGVTGQDGAYLARLLLSKGYDVHGVVRRTSLDNTDRIRDLVGPEHDLRAAVRLHLGDMTDGPALARIVASVRPDEVYNLAAQSHVLASFDAPEYAGDVNGLGALRLLEAIRAAGLTDRCRFYQASTSELFGDPDVEPQDETTPFRPRSPYAAAKLFAYWTVCSYRDAYGLHASNGVLFNHESPLRGSSFVTRKITRAVARIEHGLQDRVTLGNLNAKRDWGHARDYVRGMWRMTQEAAPGDYVLATGVTRSVREFVGLAFEQVGRRIQWRGEGLDEVGVEEETGAVRVSVDAAYFAPAEVRALRGDASKALSTFGWRAETTFETLVAEMVAADLDDARREAMTAQENRNPALSITR